MVRSLQDPPAPAAPRAGKRERSFELSLPALVKGLDAAGRKFEERTAVSGISAQEVSLRIKARLTIDARLTLFLDIPRTLILESPLRLVLSGAVVYVRFEEKNDRQQFVVVRLDRGFRLHPNSLPPA
ncbi:MAG: hypothetical protein MUE80_01410 [Acidobacteria bacterium]|jgi:hypothetical protein|nr:hypothetical protein [Acidobacteriota bacterium]